jgi:hypothetical protein
MSWLALIAAAEAADKPDPALLEFLGTVDTDDKAWHDYLAHTDIDQVAKRAVPARGNPAPVSAVPPAPVATSTPPKTSTASPPAPATPAPVSPP